MKETLFTRHRSTVEPMMVVNNRKATLQAIYTSVVHQAVNRQEVNVVLHDRPPLINNSEHDLTRKEHTTLAQLRYGHCRLLGFYKSIINKDTSLNVSADYGRTPHAVKRLFIHPPPPPAHRTTLIPSDLWRRPVDAIRELSYLEAGGTD